jgi:hypothetical protein
VNEKMKKLPILLLVALFLGLAALNAEAQFTVTVVGGVLPEVTNVATVGEVAEVTNVATVGKVLDATMDPTQFNKLTTDLQNLQQILAGGTFPGLTVDIHDATQGDNAEISVVANGTPSYPRDYTVQDDSLNFNYNGSNLANLNPAGVQGAALFRPITGLSNNPQWADNYKPFTAMEQKTDNAIKIFAKTGQNLDTLARSLQASMENLNKAHSIAEIEAINARINSIHAEMTRQIYLRTAAMQDVHLLQIASENNRMKREQANAEEESESHQKQIGDGTNIGTASSLLGVAISLITATDPGTIQ